MFKIGDRIFYTHADCQLIGTVSLVSKNDYTILITKCIQYPEIEGMEGTFDNSDKLVFLSPTLELLYA